MKREEKGGKRRSFGREKKRGREKRNVTDRNSEGRNSKGEKWRRRE